MEIKLAPTHLVRWLSPCNRLAAKRLMPSGSEQQPGGERREGGGEQRAEKRRCWRSSAMSTPMASVKSTNTRAEGGHDLELSQVTPTHAPRPTPGATRRRDYRRASFTSATWG
jgi:hypothetical protein